jgi:hypothetical protein
MSERAEFFIKGRKLLKEPYHYVAGSPTCFSSTVFLRRIHRTVRW